MTAWLRLLPLWGLWLALGTGSAVVPKPDDGGHPLQFTDRSLDRYLLNDPCWRRENGGWHFSVGHCERMTSSMQITGVWVTAFEESSFFADARSLPAPDDPARFSNEVELDNDGAWALSGYPPRDPNGEAYLLAFVGRRMLDPRFDCYGTPSFTYVVERLLSIRHLGAMKPMKPEWWKHWRPPPLRRYPGHWGALQARAIEECSRR